MWVRAWGVSPDSPLAEQPFEVSITGMSAFEGSESGPALGDVGGNEDLGAVLEGHGVGAGGLITPTPISVWAPAIVGGVSGMVTSSACVVYEFENLGVSYSNLAIKFYPHTLIDGEDEILGNPVWAAARILYRVEH